MSLQKKSRGDASLFVPGVARRGFLQRVGACSLAGVVIASVEGRSPSSGAEGKPMIENLNLAMFLPCVGHAFHVEAGGQRVAFELIEATALSAGKRPVTVRGEPFSLVFRAPATFNRDQGIYELQHDGLGALSIFLVPIGRDATGLRYEAVFN